MSNAAQSVSQAAQGELWLSGLTIVRNLDVIDLLANYCKWCGEVIFDSSTKPRQFCDNNNVCCNAYSRAKKRGKAKRSALVVCQARAKRWLKIWECGKTGSTVESIRVSRDEVIRASGKTIDYLYFDNDTIGIRKLTVGRIVERRKDKRWVKDVNQQFARCWQCGADFERPSAFPFCGETLLLAGECKRAWLAAHPQVSKPRGPVPEPTPTFTGWERGEVEHKSRAGLRRIPRKKDQPAFAIK